MLYPQTRFQNVSVSTDSPIGSRRKVVQENTLIYQLDVLRKTGRYNAFKLDWHPTYNEAPLVWPIPNHLFWDSDVAKWIEGACYFLKQQKLPEIESAVIELVDMIRHAQQPDGYLNIHYTVVEPGKRFTNLRDMHELYNAGHLIEAALAHQDVFQNGLLLEVVIKYVDLLCQTFGPAPRQIHGYPGHPEIELALLRLYDQTKNQKYLDLAKYFITERGNPQGCEGKHFFDVEASDRRDDPDKRPAFYPEPRCLWYHQAHAPVIDQQTIEGHAVRAVYLLTAVADLVRVEQSPDASQLKDALRRLWNNMVDKKMYVTGGIGATKQWEGFNVDHFLPQSTDEGGCYAETCASIGVMMLAERLLQIELDSTVADIMELCLYNVVLNSMSHDGKLFTYENQLASCNECLSTRETWFTVACCPPNVLRLFGQIGGYVWQSRSLSTGVQVTVHLYIPSTLRIQHENEEIVVTQESQWPWNGDVRFTLNDTATATSFLLRIPTWVNTFELEPRCPNAASENGYLNLSSEWIAEHRTFTLKLPLKSRWIAQHPYSGSTISLARGPIIYCVEDTDNPWVTDHFKSIMVDHRAQLVAETAKISEDEFIALKLVDGAASLDLSCTKLKPFVEVSDLDHDISDPRKIPSLNFIPYYLRANRGGKGQMRVGLRRWM